MTKECFVSKELRPRHKEDIRKRVCDGLKVSHLYEGEYYCVLHFPDNSKHKSTDFGIVLQDRLTTQKNNFEYVYFSNEQNFEGHNFTSYPSFSHSIFEKETNFTKVNFSEGGDFRYTIFRNDVDFRDTSFQQSVTFYEAQFEGDAHFSNSFFQESAIFKDTKFKQYSYFNRIKFNGRLEFIRAEFGRRTTFYSTEFKEETDFGEVRFLEDSSFDQAKFNKEVHFVNTEFKLRTDFIETIFFHYVSFTDSVFREKAYFEEAIFHKYGFFKNTEFKDCSFWRSIFEEDSEITFENVIFQKINFIFCKFRNIFTIQEHKPVSSNEARQIAFTNSSIEYPEKFTIKTFALRPHWFINIDSRKIVFTDVKWENLDNLTINQLVINELKCLKETSNSKELFKIACRQLGENAENNNRFEEASKFRQLAFETEWIEKKDQFSTRIKNLVPESEKLKRRFGGSTNEEDKPIPPTNSFSILQRSGDFFIYGLYRITSFYGESWGWALTILLTLILIVFPIIFTRLDIQVSSKGIPLEVIVMKSCAESVQTIQDSDCEIKVGSLSFYNGILHSLSSATFQDVEYRRPISFWAEFWTILEKIFAPLQAALLALALRRKFMR